MRAMKIEELDDGECSRDEEEKCQRQIVSIDAKRGWLEQVLGSCSTPHSCIMCFVTRLKLSSGGGIKLTRFCSLSLSLTHTHTQSYLISFLINRGFVVLNCCIIVRRES